MAGPAQADRRRSVVKIDSGEFMSRLEFCGHAGFVPCPPTLRTHPGAILDGTASGSECMPLEATSRRYGG
jgi:hypothetical protein